MQHHQSPAPADSSPFAKIGRDPARLLTVREFWTEFDEPTDLLDDPERTFAEDATALIGICLKHGVPYAIGGREAPTFPIWLLREFYPANP